MITIKSLLTAPIVDLYRENFVAVVAGDGLDYGMYLFDLQGNLLTSNECGFSSNIPYISAKEYHDANCDSGDVSIAEMLMSI